MTNQHADYGEPTHGLGSFVGFTFLFTCLYVRYWKQLYT